jgi:probable HAF family extracellular repeat protein
MQGLGKLSGDDYAGASDVSANGSIVMGYSDQKAFIWDAGNGMRNLKTVLSNDYGLNLSGWQL